MVVDALAIPCLILLRKSANLAFQGKYVCTHQLPQGHCEINSARITIVNKLVENQQVAKVLPW